MLRAGGAARGQLVVNTLTNSPERVVCEAAILLTGAASVNAQCMLVDGSDLLGTVRVSRAAFLLVDPDVTHSPWHVLSKYVTVDDVGNVVTSEQLPHLKRVYFVRRVAPPEDGEDFLSKMEASSESFEADDVTPDDVCSVFTTSGSSGFSKLVVHTHRALTSAVLHDNPVMASLTGEEVEFSMAPLGWLGGYAGNNILTGSVRVLCDTRHGLPADVIDFMLQAFEEEKVDLTFVPAPRLSYLVERVRQKKKEEGVPASEADSANPGHCLHIMDRLTLGGQPITRSLVQTASLLAPKLLIVYGTTETLLVSALTVTHPESYRDFDAGFLAKGAEIRIVKGGGGEGTPLLPNTSGMIEFKRRHMMKEYLHDPRATAAAFTPDGFMRTGDIGQLDQHGHVIVEGRGSDAIMRGPFIFYPGWLEERIRACPGVTDVMIVGVPDPGANEEICACVTLKPGNVTVQEVQDFVEKDIVTSDEEPMSPRPRHYLTFDSFPVTPTGKPHRKVIKQQATTRLSSSSDD